MPSREGIHPFDGYGKYNPYCMICADERGGPIGHESSECAWRTASTEQDLAATMLPMSKRLHFYVACTHAQLHNVKRASEEASDAK